MAIFIMKEKMIGEAFKDFSWADCMAYANLKEEEIY